MRKPPPTIEWQIVENEAEWEQLSAAAADHTAPSAAHRSPFFARALGSTLLLLAFLLLTRSWWWRMVDARRQPTAPTAAHKQPPLPQPLVASDYADLVTQVRNDLRREFAPKDSRLLTGIPIHAPDRYPEPAFVIIKLQHDWAVIGRVAPVKDGWLGCLVQRVYLRTASGWQPAVLDAGCQSSTTASNGDFIAPPCLDQQMNPIEQHRSQLPPTYALPELTPVCP